jgi:hypothetical protein
MSWAAGPCRFCIAQAAKKAIWGDGAASSTRASTSPSSSTAGAHGMLRSAALAGQHVLELGAGCGLAGLVAAHFAPASVTLTDNEPEVLAILRVNAARNAAPGVDCRCEDLDWGSAAAHARLAAASGGGAHSAHTSARRVCGDFAPHCVGAAPLLRTRTDSGADGDTREGGTRHLAPLTRAPIQPGRPRTLRRRRARHVTAATQEVEPVQDDGLVPEESTALHSNTLAQVTCDLAKGGDVR